MSDAWGHAPYLAHFAGGALDGQTREVPSLAPVRVAGTRRGEKFPPAYDGKAPVPPSAELYRFAADERDRVVYRVVA